MKVKVTIDGFENMTAQECLDLSVNHLFTTMKKSMNGGECTYTGSGCAAAPFIKPEFRKAMDTNAPNKTSSSWSGICRDGYASSENSKLIIGLQQSHDGCHYEYGKEFLQEFAKRVKENVDFRGIKDVNFDNLNAKLAQLTS